jgi:hypothetical protein
VKFDVEVVNRSLGIGSVMRPSFHLLSTSAAETMTWHVGLDSNNLMEEEGEEESGKESETAVTFVT